MTVTIIGISHKLTQNDTDILQNHDYEEYDTVCFELDKARWNKNDFESLPEEYKNCIERLDNFPSFETSEDFVHSKCSKNTDIHLIDTKYKDYVEKISNKYIFYYTQLKKKVYNRFISDDVSTQQKYLQWIKNKRNSDPLKQYLFDNREQAMVNNIEEVLDDGNILVLVGAMHLYNVSLLLLNRGVDVNVIDAHYPIKQSPIEKYQEYNN